MNIALLKNLLDVSEAFSEAYPTQADQTLDRFIDWLTKGRMAVAEPALTLEKAYLFSTNQLTTFIADHLTQVYRYQLHYAKKAIEPLPLISFQDYLSLVHLAQAGSMTKTELIEVTLNEKTSGMLVIKRLVDNGLVSQTGSQQDRRSVCIELTPAGWSILQQVEQAMNQATTIMTRALTEAEQDQLAKLLLKMATYHHPLYVHQRDATLSELLTMTAR